MVTKKGRIEGWTSEETFKRKRLVKLQDEWGGGEKCVKICEVYFMF